MRTMHLINFTNEMMPNYVELTVPPASSGASIHSVSISKQKSSDILVQTKFRRQFLRCPQDSEMRQKRGPQDDHSVII